MTDLEKTRNISILTRHSATPAAKFLQIIHFFSTSVLTEIKQCQFS